MGHVFLKVGEHSNRGSLFIAMLEEVDFHVPKEIGPFFFQPFLQSWFAVLVAGGGT